MEMETSCPHGSGAGKPVKIDSPHVHTESRGRGGIKEKMKCFMLEFRIQYIKRLMEVDVFMSALLTPSVDTRRCLRKNF